MQSSLPTQMYILIGILVLTAVFWFIGALSAYSGYRAFKQRVDLGWAGAFLVMGLVCLGYAWEAYGWTQGVHLLSTNMQSLQNTAAMTRLRFAAIEMLAVFAILYLFRTRRQVF
jgi:hypothetical protein